MKQLKKTIFIIITLVFILILLMNYQVFAENNTNSIQKREYSEDFKKWLELSDEEKSKVIQPRMYDVPYNKVEYKNPFKKMAILGSSLNPQFNLKNIVEDNLSIKDQQTTSSCWAFAALSSLETNLALRDYFDDKELNVYDFSERHMEYATSRVFKDNKINSMGYNRTVGSGGNWGFASSYLTNGIGAIDELDMPFINDEKSIDISEIQNKTVSSQVYDTVEFPNYNDISFSKEEVEEIKNQIKYHIQNYGSVFASVKAGSFAGILSPVSNTTGALALGAGFADHGVSIVGWDDNYSISNWDEFEEYEKPKNQGAWIVRNSWGTTSGKDGYIYVSYEDQLVSKTLAGIIKATNSVDYDNIYQYDYYYPNYQYFSFEDQLMICNVFDKETSKSEYLTQVSLHVPEACTCKVYVNPNGTEKSKDNLKPVLLKEGESETFNNTGYHTLEFKKPIEITGNQFAVAIEISSDKGSNHVSCVETSSNEKDPYYSVVEIQEGKSFILDTYGKIWDENYENSYYDYDWSGWEDLSEKGRISTIKAFTTNELIDESLKDIEIVEQPKKISYFEGEDFNNEGMVVKANYNSKNNPTVILSDTDYSISNGTNLTVGQESVTITYKDKSVEQAITVQENSVTDLKITKEPTKTNYKEGQNFDPAGMTVEATYKNGTKKTITDYKIEDGNNLESNQTEVTISYGGQTAKQTITVIPNPLVEIKITKTPNKVNYVVGQNFDPTGMIVTGKYQDGDEQEISGYIIENGTDLKKEQTYVTIKYKEKTATQEITVEEKAVTKISVDKQPSKVKYIQNKEELDLTGGTIKVTYNDETTENISMTSDEVSVSGFNNENIGNITITLAYQSKTTQFEVKIVEEEKAVNSNLDNIESDIKKVQAYYFTNKSENNYTLINVEIDKISRNMNNDKVEYYYYLSSNPNEQDITEWTKITESQNDSNKLQFTIDSRKITNYNKIASEEVLYLYIKEVAINGADQSVAISKSMKLETDKNIETYVDNVKKENLQQSSNSDTNKSDKDNTISSDILPNTGITSVVIISLIGMLLLGVFFYTKYNKFKDIK